MSILLLRAGLFDPGQDASDLTALADWVVAVEAKCRDSETLQQDSDEWLLGLTLFNQRHSAWRRVIREVLLDPTKDVSEPAWFALHEIAGRIAEI